MATSGSNLVSTCALLMEMDEDTGFTKKPLNSSISSSFSSTSGMELMDDAVERSGSSSLKVGVLMITLFFSGCGC